MESLRRFEKSPFKTPQREWFFELLLELEGKKGSEEIVKIFQNFGGNDKSGQTKKGNSFEVLTDLRNLLIGQFGSKKISERWFTRDPLNRTDLLVPSEVRDILDLGEGDNKGHDIVYKVIDLEKSTTEYILSQAKNTSKRKIGRGILESTTSHLNKLLLSPEKPLGENPHYQISTLAEEIDGGIDIFPGSVSIIGPAKNNYISFIEKHFGGDGNKLISALIEYAVSGIVPTIKERKKDKKLWKHQIGGVLHTKRCHESGSRASTNSFATGTGKSNSQAAECFTLCSDNLKIPNTENFTTFTRVPNITLANQMVGDFLETSDEFDLSELGVDNSFDVQRIFLVHSARNKYSGLDECYLNDPRIVFIHTKEDLYNAMVWSKETKQWGLIHFVITNHSFSFSSSKVDKKIKKSQTSYFHWASRKFEKVIGKKFLINHRTNDEAHHLTGIIRAENEEGEVLAKSWAEDLYRHSYLQGLDEIPYFVKTDSFWSGSLIEVKEMADYTKKIREKINKFGITIVGSNTEEIFGKINEYTMLEGQKDGILCPVEVILSFVTDSPEENPELYEVLFDRDKVRLEDPTEPYVLISDPSIAVGEKIVDDVFSIITRTQPFYKAIFKANTEEKCKQLEKLYEAKKPDMCRKLGISEEEFFVGYVHSNLKGRINESRIKKFQNSKYGIIIQVDMLSEGFCEKSCNHTHPWSRTESSVTIQQFNFGRGIRKDPKNPNKVHYTSLPIPCTKNIETGAIVPLLKEWTTVLETVMRIGWNPTNFVDGVTLSIEASKKNGEDEIVIENSGTKLRIPNIWKEWSSKDKKKFYKSLGLSAVQMREDVCSTFEYPYEVQKEFAQNAPDIKIFSDWAEKWDKGAESGWTDWYKYSRNPVSAFPNQFEGWTIFIGRNLHQEMRKKIKDDFIEICRKKHEEGYCRTEVLKEFSKIWGDYFVPCKFNPHSKHISYWKGEKLFDRTLESFGSGMQEEYSLEWRQYWREDRIEDFFRLKNINSQADLKREREKISDGKNSSLGIPLKDSAFTENYGRGIKTFYSDVLSSRNNSEIYEGEELLKMSEIYINRFGIYRTEELNQIRGLSKDVKFPSFITNITGVKKTGMSGAEIIERLKSKNVASIEQCVDLILYKGIKTEEEWNLIITGINSEKLWYPCFPCEYYFNPSYSSPDKTTPIKTKEILLRLSKNIEVHKNYCRGNKEDVKRWMEERGVKSSIEREVRKNKEFSKLIPYWIPSSPSGYYNISTSYFVKRNYNKKDIKYVAVYKGEYCTMWDLCQKLGISRITVSRVKNGDRKNVYGIEFL